VSALQPCGSYLLKWRLSDPRILAKTFTSIVYRVRLDDRDVVLKVLNRTGAVDEAGGAAALRYFDGDGAVRLLEHDEGAQLLEYASGGDLVPMVLAGRDEQASEIIADVLTRLHRPRGEQPMAELTPLDRRFSSLFAHAAVTGDALFERAASVAEQLLSTQTSPCVLHGDIHHENIRDAGERGWLAIDPKGLYGERTFDAANVFLNPQQSETVLNEQRFARTTDVLSDRLHLDHARLLRFVFSFACLSAAWSLADGQNPASALAVARIAEERLNPTH
jgi:streptomycin 6-kinase